MNSSIFKFLSRQEFLKLGGLGLLGTLIPPLQASSSEPSISWGRVLEESVDVFEKPSFSANVLRSYAQDNILSIYRTVIGGPELIYNQAWYQVGDSGYVHSSLLQPVEIKFNQPVSEIVKWGQLAEVSVPFTSALLSPNRDSQRMYRYYYASTHWVNKVIVDDYDQVWYRVMDDQVKGNYYFVRASHLRIIPEEELAPLSPEVPLEHKKLEVRVEEQLVVAYENNSPVYIVQASTGDLEKWETPLGEFKTFYKRPSRHMAAGNLAFGDYDLPGVPWVSYLTDYGIAFHGTYWHYEFGKARSHGCINLTPEAAKWIYRWTQPVVPPDYELRYREGFGTRVDIF